MKKWTWTLVALVVALACTAGPSWAASKEDMIKAADGVDAAFLKAFNEGDLEALAAMYWNSPDVLLFPPDAMVAKGMDSLRSSLVQMINSMKGCKLELIEKHQIPAGDMVIGWGLWRMTMPGPDSTLVEMFGRYTDVKAERDGKWVYILDHASVPMAPPADVK